MVLYHYVLILSSYTFPSSIFLNLMIPKTLLQAQFCYLFFYTHTLFWFYSNFSSPNSSQILPTFLPTQLHFQNEFHAFCVSFILFVCFCFIGFLFWFSFCVCVSFFERERIYSTFMHMHRSLYAVKEVTQKSNELLTWNWVLINE